MEMHYGRSLKDHCRYLGPIRRREAAEGDEAKTSRQPQVKSLTLGAQPRGCGNCGVHRVIPCESRSSQYDSNMPHCKTRPKPPGFADVMTSTRNRFKLDDEDQEPPHAENLRVDVGI